MSRGPPLRLLGRPGTSRRPPNHLLAASPLSNYVTGQSSPPAAAIAVAWPDSLLTRPHPLCHLTGGLQHGPIPLDATFARRTCRPSLPRGNPYADISRLGGPANRLAAALADRGVRRGDAVAVRVHTPPGVAGDQPGHRQTRRDPGRVNYRLTGYRGPPHLLDCACEPLSWTTRTPAPCSPHHRPAPARRRQPRWCDAGYHAYPDMIANGDRPTARPDDLAQIIIYSSGTDRRPPRGSP